MIRWKITEMMGKYQMETGKRLTVAELATASGVARSSVSTAVAGHTKRIDFGTLDKLLSFFERELEEAVKVGDLLEYVPDHHLNHTNST